MKESIGKSVKELVNLRSRLSDLASEIQVIAGELNDVINTIIEATGND